MRWGGGKVWVGVDVVLAALLVAGTVSRRGKHSSGQGPAVRPSPVASNPQDRRRQQIEALDVLVNARRKCAGLQASISRSWRSAIDQGLEPSQGYKQA